MEKTIDIEKLLYAVLRQKWKIIIALAAGFLIGFVYSVAFISPSYAAGFTVYIGNSADYSSVQTVTNADTTAAISITKTYAEILKSRGLLEKVKEQLSYEDVTIEELRDSIGINIRTETQLIDMYITTHSAQKSKDIADVFADVAPKYAESIVDGSSMKVISYPTLPTTASAPNVKKNAAFGGFIGAVIAVLVIAIKKYFDTKIDDTKDLEYMYNIPVLGVIPYFGGTENHAKKK